jgi:hypothetical protein
VRAYATVFINKDSLLRLAKREPLNAHVGDHDCKRIKALP